MNASKLVRPIVRGLHPYVPGEQPKIRDLVKLNTNENPYPPSPAVLRAVKNAVDGRLRLYPDPTAAQLRARLASFHGCKPENIIVGNGSDELLAMAVRAFVEPETGCKTKRKCTVQYFTPSYSLYPVLAATHGARTHAVKLGVGFSLPRPRAEATGWDNSAALSFVTTPNAPSGRGYSTEELDALCRRHRGVIVLDEAYVDFAHENALKLALKYPHVMVARTFSKAYSLCFQRIGYLIGHPTLVEALDKIRDSYNVNGLGQVAALATLDNLPYYIQNFRKIVATRQRLSAALGEVGFDVLPSSTNFILTRPPGFPAEEWLQKLRGRRILVRWFKDPAVQEYLRITVGTDAEADILISVVKRLVR